MVCCDKTNGFTARGLPAIQVLSVEQRTIFPVRLSHLPLFFLGDYIHYLTNTLKSLSLRVFSEKGLGVLKFNLNADALAT